MNCDRFREWLSGHLEGLLSREAELEFEAHLAACPECAELLELAAWSRRELAELTAEEPSSELLARLYMVAGPRKKGFFRAALDFLNEPVVQPVLAGLTMLFIMISFMVGTPQGRAFRKEVNRTVHAGYSRAERIYARAGDLTGKAGSLAGSLLDSLKTLKPADGEAGKK
jgi:hypothetical protein